MIEPYDYNILTAVSTHWFTLTCGLKGHQRVLHCEKIWSWTCVNCSVL